MKAHHERLRSTVRSVETGLHGTPWVEVVTLAVGGLTEVGWSASGGHLLVVSSSGRGLLDASTGTWTARDRDTSFEDWFDASHVTALGIGPFGGERINVAGLAGGGLASQTRDGWSIEVLHPDWPFADVVLCPPGCSVLYEVSQPGKHLPGCRRIKRNLELRAAGFAPTGTSLAVADGSGVTLFRRLH